MFKKLKYMIVESAPFRKIRALLYVVRLPGFSGLPLLYVLEFFIKGAQRSSITNRAAAASFKFFMGIFPGIIFLMSIIPYVPVPNFHHKLLVSIEGIIPAQVYPMFEQAIVDVVKRRQTGLLSLGFLIALFFSTNGMNGLMKAFNESAFITETRKPIKQRGVAFLLTFSSVLTLILTVTFMVLSNRFVTQMYQEHEVGKTLYNLLLTLKWLPVFVVLYFQMAVIFYLAPARTMRSGFFSAGALAATLFSILFTYLISIYINNFNNYNKIYGVLGTFPIILIWIFLNSLSLIIGFELNVSIRHAESQRK